MEIKELLELKFDQYNRSEFIETDPILIPHQFNKQQDIEIMAFFAATFAWGQRKTIINKSKELVSLFSNTPYDFVVNHSDKDLKQVLNFKHRTFNSTDLLYFIEFLKLHYKTHTSLEFAFSNNMNTSDGHIGNALIGFHNYFFSLDFAPQRTRKHVATPDRGSTCKRLNMFLRWMVRSDDKGVDFGIWKRIKPSQLLCPIDVHVSRTARNLDLLLRKQTDWKAALELTENLRAFDPSDPAKYDFALFGMGVLEKA